MTLEGKVAIVTGAARGTGAAIARRFVERGSHVFLGDLRDPEGEVAGLLASLDAPVNVKTARACPTFRFARASTPLHMAASAVTYFSQRMRASFSLCCCSDTTTASG